MLPILGAVIGKQFSEGGKLKWKDRFGASFFCFWCIWWWLWKRKGDTTHKGHQEVAKTGDPETEWSGYEEPNHRSRSEGREGARGGPWHRSRLLPERQQLIGVKFGTVEMRPLEKVIRTVGRVDYDEKRIVTVAPRLEAGSRISMSISQGGCETGGPSSYPLQPGAGPRRKKEYLIALRAKKSLTKSPFPEVSRERRVSGRVC